MSVSPSFAFKKAALSRPFEFFFGHGERLRRHKHYDNNIVIAAEGFLFFLFYWGLPYVGGVLTLVHLDDGRPDRVLDFTQTYMRDGVHFGFAVLLASGFSLGASLKRKVHAKLWLSTAALTSDGRAAFAKAYRRALAILRSPVSSLGFIAFGVLCGVIFVNRANDVAYTAWWGHVDWGHAGTIYAFVVAVSFMLAMIYLLFVTWLFLSIVIFARKHLRLRPFHRDGHCGLSRFGRLVNAISVQALIGCGLILVAYWSDYLRLLANPLIIGFLAISLAVLTLLPIAAVASLSLHARRLKLQLIANLLTAQHKPVPIRHTAEVSDRIAAYVNRRNELMAISSFPFPRLNLTLIGLWSLVQLFLGSDVLAGYFFSDPDLLTLREALGLLARSIFPPA